MDNLLTILILLPMTAAVILLLFLRGDDAIAQRNARRLALTATLSTFAVVLFILGHIDLSDPGPQLVEDREWAVGIRYLLAVDGVSLPFLAMITALFPFAVAAEWGADWRVKERMLGLLLAESFAIGALVSADLVLFFLFFQSLALPVFLLVGVFGGAGRARAAREYVATGLAGAALALAAILWMRFEAGGTGMADLARHVFPDAALDLWLFTLPGGVQSLVFLCFSLWLALHLPLFPLHRWAMNAAREGGRSARFLIVVVVAPIALYALLRIVVPLVPAGAALGLPYLAAAALVALFYGALTALLAPDLEQLTLRAALAWMGLLGLAATGANPVSASAVASGVWAYGLAVSGLIFAASFLFDRVRHTDISRIGGVLVRMPMLGVTALVLIASMLALPGTAGFVALLRALVGAGGIDQLLLILLAFLPLIFALMNAYRRVFFGEFMRASLKGAGDLGRREGAILWLLALAVLLLGLAPWLVDPLAIPGAVEMGGADVSVGS
ncbi:MAG: hypothetical protein CR993_02075 [Rhodobacterales bacterium]|nr:MAG: hypothetical protein CR993_02075 [Rhodobacterales bacterium]